MDAFLVDPSRFWTFQPRLRYLAPPSFSKMVMPPDLMSSTAAMSRSVCLVAIVFPAWRIYILPTERELSEETTEEGAEKALLKEYAKQHFELFLRNKTDENDLDRAHLLMKRHRRTAHGLKHPGSAAAGSPATAGNGISSCRIPYILTTLIES